MQWSPFQKFIFTRTYSRWLEDAKRRETYEEAVDRVINFFTDHITQIRPAHKAAAKKAIINMEVMPSMRMLWAAGKAVEENNIAAYNCSYVVINDVRTFSEILYILMSGTGVGFSAERRFVDALPMVAARDEKVFPVKVEDSKEGWAKALNQVLTHLWNGHDVAVDYSAVRPRGARLRTMGGRASGPAPLKNLFDYARKLFACKGGKKLTPLEAHDLCCMIADIVVVGGVRRSSLISLSDLSDQDIAECKTGEFWNHTPHRKQANNSAVYQTKPEGPEFLEEWVTLMKSGAGERGIFNREAAMKQMTASGRRAADADVGTNPCGEILLKPNEFCNLSSVVIRPNDTLQSLKEKVKLATMIGVWQSTFIKFPYLRKEWHENCFQERLLGVSLTGIMDHPLLNHVNDEAKHWLSEMKHAAISEARRWSKKLCINMSAAITCVKPEGTSSSMNNSSSGIHPRYAKHYVRRVRISATDPLFKMMQSQGVPCSPEVGQEPNTADTWVLEFPIAAPADAITRHDMTAIQQLEHWLMVKTFWCEHNPSCTVYVGEQEWVSVAAWVYEHFDQVSGLSFLPREDNKHVYQLAPFEEITADEYKTLLAAFPEIDYHQLNNFEVDDNTEGAKSLACTGDKCEIV